MIGEVIDDGEGGHREDAAFPHQPHGFVAQLVGVIDGCHAGARRLQRAGLAGGVHGHLLAPPRRLRNPS